MSILHLVRCERYEACKQEFSFGVNTHASDFAPDNWITLFEGNPRLTEGYNFCSKSCLFNWLLDSGQPPLQEQDEYINVMCKPLGDGTLRSLASGTIYRPVDEQQPQEQSSCKARRFLLVDENANIQEGIKWANGKVTIEADTEIWTYQSWDELKRCNDGSGVQWIDQEVSE